MSTVGKAGGSGPQCLNLENSAALSYSAGLPGESYWDLVSPTVPGALVPGFRWRRLAQPGCYSGKRLH